VEQSSSADRVYADYEAAQREMLDAAGGPTLVSNWASKSSVTRAYEDAMNALPCGRCGSGRSPKTQIYGTDEPPFIVCADCSLGLDVALDSGPGRLPWSLGKESCSCGWNAYVLVSKPLRNTASWWDDPGAWYVCPACRKLLGEV